MHRLLSLLTLVGCGRIGFDSSAATSKDAGGDASAMFVPAVGELDPTFGTDGQTTTTGGALDLSGYDLLRRPTGYVVVGVHGKLTGTSAIALVGYTFEGQLDAAFGTAGLVDLGAGNDFGYGAVRIDANRIALVGDGNIGATDDDFVLAMVDDSGALDSSFGSAGIVRNDVANAQRNDTANSAAVLGSSIIACGVQGRDDTDSAFALLRVGFDGQPIASWGTNGTVADELGNGTYDECFDAVALGSDVIAVGKSGDNRFVVVAYHEANGMRDTAFAGGGIFELVSGGSDAAAVIAVDNEIVAVGESGGRAVVVRLTAAGTPRAGFGTAGVVEVDTIDTFSAVVAQPDGKLVAAGITNDQPALVRMTADGVLDASFGRNGILTIASANPIDVTSLLLDPDGKLVIAGISGTGPLESYLARIR